MINYVNNAYDKCLKPCDAQQFSNIINSPKTEELITRYRDGEDRAKPNLPALTYMGVFDKEKWTQTSRNNGTRKAELMRPTGLLMLDFDHIQSQARTPEEGPTLTLPVREGTQPSRPIIDSPIKLWEYIVSEYRERGAELSDDVALAHVTPSGEGLRVVVKRVKGFTIERSQQEWCQAMELDKVGIKPDAACKDISRLSFAPMQKEILYFNPSLLFGELLDAGDYPDGSLWGGDPLRATLGTPSAPQSSARPSINRGTVIGATYHPEGERQQTPPLFIEGVPEGRGSSKQSAEQTFPTDYNGIGYEEIIKRLEEQLGGRPEHGARNAFIFTMACNLRYICNDDAQWVASILPTYGEEPQKHRTTIQSAINRPMSREMPETLKRALRIASLLSENAENSENSEFKIQNTASGAPALPEVLPAPIALLTSRTPHPMKEAVAMAVFPPLGAHLYKTEFMYIDNRPYEATFMNLLMAELSSGKSAVNQPIEYIIADMRARDKVNRRREREWKEQCATIANTKDRPERPKNLSVQVLTPDMTNAAFVQRLADADGRFLYTMMDEVDLLDAFKTNGRQGSVSQIIRLAFDRGRYGQERVGTTSVNEQVNVRWNWNASTTIQRGRNYLRRSISDGTLSRLSFATIIRDENDWGRTIPRFGTYGDAFAEELRPYIDALNTCHGTLHCPEAEQWAERALDELLTHAEMSDDRAYAQMSRRAVLMGFLRGMVLYIMNGMQWSQEIDEFAAWSVRYDMWCKMHFFGDLMHQEMEAETMVVTGNKNNLLDLLPSEFTRQMAQDMRIAQGRKPSPKDMLAQWTHRGYIVKDEARNVYIKLRA